MRDGTGVAATGSACGSGCSVVDKLVSIDNCLALRSAKGLSEGEVIETGRYRFRFLATPQVPYCWEAGLLFEETERTLLCSDLFHQNWDVEPMTESEVIDRCRETLADYVPSCSLTEATLHRLAALQPKRLATMHGSVYVGDGSKAIHDLATVWREVLGSPS
ncbi:MAG: hypothetical protein CV081_07660 [Nitrospira sp. LK265]|nr:hypothetical protein [Nitrospira sp.]NGZ60361.1 hypothetical protein [Nitrospira sp. LK265]